MSILSRKFVSTNLISIVELDAKEMVGHLSHEYHYLSSIGEAKLENCPKCQHYSIDTTENEAEGSKCLKCGDENVEKLNGIEARTKFLDFLDVKSRDSDHNYCNLFSILGGSHFSFG